MDYSVIPEEHIIFTVPDDSMSPRCEQGDTIEVDPCAEWHDGDAVVAVIEDGRTIFSRIYKSVDGFLFNPDNRLRYQPIFSKAPVIIGKAIRLYRSM